MPRSSASASDLDTADILNEDSAFMDVFSHSNKNNSSAFHYHLWRGMTISGILRNAISFGEGWWYRIKLADETIASEVFEHTEVFGQPLRNYAKSWFPLPQGCCYVVWSPQWVPAGSVPEDLKIAFWKRMPFRFWELTRSFDEHMIWREEVEQYIYLSRSTSEHLCTREGCRVCDVKSNLQRALSSGR